MSLPPQKPPMKKPLVQKSGDSRLQDAQAARTKDLTSKGTGLETVAQELQDSVEQKRAAGASPESVKVAKADLDRLQKLCEALMDQNRSAFERIQKLEQGGTRSVTTPTPKVRCGVCFQIAKVADGRGVCDGEHVVVRVVPDDSAMWKFFQGVEYNGVKYANHVLLPRVIVNDVMSIVRRWEANEKKLYIASTRNFGEVDVRGATVGMTPIIS